MKKTLLIALLALACLLTEAQIRMPAASPAGSVSTTVGLTDIKVEYSRPKMKGRTIFGEESAGALVPYGHIWRTGANNGTKISFSDNVTVEGIEVAKGEYLIFSWPGANEWTVSLYNDLSLGGNTDGYDESKEAARFKVKPTRRTEKVETFTVNIADLADDNKSASIELVWENTSVKFKVGVDYDAQVMKAIEASTKVNPFNYYQAAVYYRETGKDMNKALEWMNLALAEQKEPPFWMLYQKALIQKAVGDNKGAKETATASLNGAKKSNNRDYQKMNEDLIKSLK